MKSISIKEASLMSGMSEQYIRIGLQRGFLKFGSAVKMSSKWTYHIPLERFREYIGELK